MNIAARLLILAAVLALPACGDPEASAQSAIDKANTEWQQASQDGDPVSRVKRYDQVIKDVEAVSKDYPDTTVGRALAAGRAVSGVSLAAMKQQRDVLAPRAECYANPTVECLRPFGSSASNKRSAGSAQSEFAQAEELVCTQDFAAADKALAPFKINKEAYAKELIQVAFAAAKCAKPDAVKAAIGAYMEADPALGGQQASDLLSLLNTADFAAAHPLVTAALEKKLDSGAIKDQDAANVTLTLAVAKAKAGDAKAAMKLYAEFTDKLHYRADLLSLQTLATNLMADGDVDDGIKLIEYSDKQDVLVPQLHKAAMVLASRLGLADETGVGPRNLGDDSIEDYFSSVDGGAKAQYQAGADALAAEFDKVAPGLHVSQQSIGIVGLDSAYAILAVIYRKLGEPDQSLAALKKGADLRGRLLAKYPNNYELQYFATWRVLLAVADGDLVTAANYVHANNLGYDYGPVIYREVGRKLDAEKAISIINTVDAGSNTYNAYNMVIRSMSAAGKQDEVEKLIGAFPGKPGLKQDLYWTVVDGMIAAGDAAGAKSYAEKHELVKDDRGRYSLDVRLMRSKKIAGDRDKAAPILNEMFGIADAKEKASQASGGYAGRTGASLYEAQSVATMAFENGFTDLGVDFYEKAAVKDQRPLLQAFTDHISKADMTKVLMLAQDNVRSPQYQSYVVDAAIRHLQAAGG